MKALTLTSGLILSLCFLTGRTCSAAGTVTIASESNLRAALAGGGLVTFAVDGTIILTNSIVITNHTTLDGSGRKVTLSGGNAVRVVSVLPSVGLILNQLTIADGYLGNGQDGAGLLNQGNCTVVNCTFSNNVLATIPGFGGAISHVGGTLTVNGSTFVNNRCEASAAAIGINVLSGSASRFAMTNCTFSGNSNGFPNGTIVGGVGAGAHITNPYWIVNCTLISNYNGGIGFGSLDANDMTATVVNTIVAHSTGSAGNFGGNKLVDGGYNISSDASAVLTNSTSLKNTDPFLAPLADYGGPTWTAALLEASPAVNAGDDAAAPLSDQRGVSRPISSHVDIGAFEGITVSGGSNTVRFAASSFSALEGLGNSSVRIQRTGSSAGSVSVGFSASAGTATAGQDFVATNVTITFASGEMEKSAPDFILDDLTPEVTETVLLTLHDPIGISLGTPDSAILNIVDDDSGIPVCDEASLRSALTTGGLIHFSCDSTIVLTSTLAINGPTIIDANGHNVTLDGSNGVRIFNVPAGRSLILSNLTIARGLNRGLDGAPGEAGGPGSGGAIWVAGSLTADGCAFLTNAAAGGSGGVRNVIPQQYGAGGLAHGGAIYNFGGQVLLKNCLLAGNLASGGKGASSGSSFALGGNGGGGAIYSIGGKVHLINCSLLANNSFSPGEKTGGLVRDSGLAYGGGIQMNGGELVIDNSLLAGNQAQAEAGNRSAYGGALAHTNGTLTIRNSLFQGNRLVGSRELVYTSFPGGTPGNDVFGGGLYLEATVAAVTNSSFVANLIKGGRVTMGQRPGGSAGGAIYNAGSLTMVNCTLADNQAAAGDNQIPFLTGYSSGGAIHNIGTLQLRNVTVANNAVVPSPANYSTNLNLFGGGILSTNGTALLVNTIAANNGPSGSNSFGALTDLGHNLSSDASCNFTNVGSLNNADPKLGPLDDYDGFTPTIPLLAGSAAIDAGDTAAAPSTDQRGRARPYGPASDIGAFESSPPYVIRGQVSGSTLTNEVVVNSSNTSAGYFSLEGLTPGTHLVTPADDNYVFDPTNRSILLGPDAVQVNFKAYRWNALSVEGISNGVVHFVFAGTNGQSHLTLASSNFSSWTAIATNVVGPTNLLHIFESMDKPFRVYRMMRLQ